ncbi:MAG: AAA family ATPase [Methanobacteriaceae archaeon]|jgi:dephospho-CoA kinase|nr:AAA family ATPase [Candidatus Methanorudis spinitermitis]
MKVIGVSGLPGSGKSLVSNISKKYGVYVVKMGDIIREEAEKRNEDSGTVAVNLRKEHGQYVVAKFTIVKIRKLFKSNKNYKKGPVFVVDGIRSPYEVKLLKKYFKNFVLLSIFSSPKTRFNRLKNRKRSDDSIHIEDFHKRDERELDFGIGTVISTSDYIIVNEEGIGKYKNQINKFFQKEIPSKL